MAEKRGERGHFRLLSEIKWGVEIRQPGSDICSKLHMQRGNGNGNKTKQCKKREG